MARQVIEVNPDKLAELLRDLPPKQLNQRGSVLKFLRHPFCSLAVSSAGIDALKKFGHAFGKLFRAFRD